MNIDERLDKLLQSTELLKQATETLKQETEMLKQIAASHDADITGLIHLQSRNEEWMANMKDYIDRLSRIAFVHENRITGLEGGRA